ncbi:hypothetical protein NDU88_006368 [Pleurodeles waltl]|uniref:Uncharacterized protein n=1 Tax=Pleurodeles waltl TaxID=8319 RepID=A0AAV7RMV1_PLEWA|nr:hypothetical protein NDU88_006368 [Pleurodeles waltl]
MRRNQILAPAPRQAPGAADEAPSGDASLEEGKDRDCAVGAPTALTTAAAATQRTRPDRGRKDRGCAGGAPAALTAAAAATPWTPVEAA